jgi:hypothetical protein
MVSKVQGLPVALELLEAGTQLVCVHLGAAGQHVGCFAIKSPARQRGSGSRATGTGSCTRSRSRASRRWHRSRLRGDGDDDRTGARVPRTDVPLCQRGRRVPRVSTGHGTAMLAAPQLQLKSASSLHERGIRRGLHDVGPDICAWKLETFCFLRIFWTWPLLAGMPVCSGHMSAQGCQGSKDAGSMLMWTRL